MLDSSFIGRSLAGREMRQPHSRDSFRDVAVTLGGIVRKGAEVVLSVMLFGFFVWRGIRNQSIGASIVYSVLGVGVYAVLLLLTRLLFKPPEK